MRRKHDWRKVRCCQEVLERGITYRMCILDLQQPASFPTRLCTKVCMICCIAIPTAQ